MSWPTAPAGSLGRDASARPRTSALKKPTRRGGFAQRRPGREPRRHADTGGQSRSVGRRTAAVIAAACSDGVGIEHGQALPSGMRRAQRSTATGYQRPAEGFNASRSALAQLLTSRPSGIFDGDELPAVVLEARGLEQPAVLLADIGLEPDFGENPRTGHALEDQAPATWA